MNIYLIERNDNPWYDETHGMVVVAKTQEDAIKYFLVYINEGELRYNDRQITQSAIEIRHIGRTTEDYVYDVAHMVLRDFHAG